MDLRKLKTLIDLVSESNISELEITEAEGKVRIVKAMAAAVVPVATPNTAAAPATPMPPPPSATPPATVVAEAAPAAEGKVIKSPMVGTFYRSASAGAKPFVEVGSSIQEGEPVCIIEAMKIMNEIEADCGGKILRILCENGQAVEFGQALFVVE